MPFLTGVGLQTPRGSGTSGYIQTNKSFIKQKSRLPQNERELLAPPKAKKANLEILEHDRLRKIELQLIVYREQLEERKYPEADIEKKVAEKRKEVEKKMGRPESKADLTDTHHLSAAKELENEKLRKAFGIRDDFVEGAAFKQLEDKRGGLGQSAPGVPKLFGAPEKKEKKKEELKMPTKFLDRDTGEVPLPRGKRDRREGETEQESKPPVSVSEPREREKSRRDNSEEPPSRRQRRDDDEGSSRKRRDDEDRRSTNSSSASSSASSSSSSRGSSSNSRGSARDDRQSSRSSRDERSSRRDRSRSDSRDRRTISRSLRAQGNEKIVVAENAKLVASASEGSDEESPKKKNAEPKKKEAPKEKSRRRSKSSSSSSSSGSDSSSGSSSDSSSSGSDSD